MDTIGGRDIRWRIGPPLFRGFKVWRLYTRARALVYALTPWVLLCAADSIQEQRLLMIFVRVPARLSGHRAMNLFIHL